MEYTKATKWLSLVVLSLALAIIIIDTTLLNVSLGTIIREFGTTIQSIQWVITAYALMLAAFTVTGGRIGDLYGRKKMFMLGAAIFAIGSLIASYSHTIPVLLFGESIIEGIGAALMMPATASLLVATFKGRERAVAFGVWGGIAAASSAIGPILGGYLTSHYSWRWGFRINVFVAAVLLLGSFIIQESREHEEKAELDVVGVVLSAAGLLGVVFGIIESATYGWWKAKEIFQIGGYPISFGDYSVTPISIAIGLLLLYLFVVWELRREGQHHTPLISMRLFKNRQFASSVATLGTITLGMTGIIFIIPVFLQSVAGLDAFHTGLALLPLSAALLITSPLSAILSKWIPPRTLIQTGLLINIAALVLLILALSPSAGASSLIIPLGLYGIGMGLIMSQINNLALSAVSVEQAGEASGVNNTFRQIGSSLGSAIIGAVLIGSIGSNLGPQFQKSAVIPAALKSKLSHISEKQISGVEFGGNSFEVAGAVPPQIQNEITSISHTVTTAADQKALLYAILFAILGYAVSFTLPKGKNIERGESVGVH
ncbi:MAG: MFS transporter [Candidatus Sungbacteria bacterium]|uniref:MFS transporter n=1 Tax=Candidatus Sungiibacteriota bacterium TaxID=2750080 RepID=A0A9D6QRX5_9BACT|nr:MFS transporter [Candidatus Sungbacteria bacterium]